MRSAESFIGQPVRSLQTMLQVLQKSGQSLPVIIPDGIYGQDTVSAVTAFQRQNNLPITGVTDLDTWERITDAYRAALIEIEKAPYVEVPLPNGMVMGYGDSSPYLFLVQSMLTVLANGYRCFEAPTHSGVIDTKTTNALHSFQELNGIRASGALDRMTWKHLAKQFTLEASRQSRSSEFHGF